MYRNVSTSVNFLTSKWQGKNSVSGVLALKCLLLTNRLTYKRCVCINKIEIDIQQTYNYY